LRILGGKRSKQTKRTDTDELDVVVFDFNPSAREAEV
jgi:hypothetical protein